jgi:pyruvate dehydrogenase E1 component alpha subunit/2-oxoisovalerate dehydrogenase E1 component alpha subunit
VCGIQSATSQSVSSTFNTNPAREPIRFFRRLGQPAHPGSALEPDKAARFQDVQRNGCKKGFPAARLQPMLQTLLNQNTVDEVSSVRDAYVKAYRLMLLARLLDDKFASLYRMGKIHGGVFLGRGQEALSVSVGLALRKGDIFAPLIRDGAGRLAFGEPILDAVRTYLGSPLGPMRARDGNVHRGRPKEGLFAMISHLGAMISVVNGALLAHRLKGISGTVGVACIGDGATSTGAFHEGMNQAAVEKLPLVLIVANNQYAYSTPIERQFACRSLLDKAVGYGISGQEVDGTDLADCLKVAGEAISRARAGCGPQMVVAELLRLCGHGEHDDASYIDARLKQSRIGRDCLKVAEGHLLHQNWADAPMLAAWRNQAVQTVEESVAKVQREPGPDPYKEDWCALASKHLSEGHEQG